MLAWTFYSSACMYIGRSQDVKIARRLPLLQGNSGTSKMRVVSSGDCPAFVQQKKIIGTASVNLVGPTTVTRRHRARSFIAMEPVSQA